MATTPRKSAARSKVGSQPTLSSGSNTVLVLNGPNLNLLGTREPAIYGHDTLPDVLARLVAQGKAAGVAVTTFQSNHEGALVDRVHAARTEGVRFVIINPGALTHTSVALRDALTGVDIPFIEVHLTNVHAREAFRHHSYFSDKAVGTIVGLGPRGYEFALAHVITRLEG